MGTRIRIPNDASKQLTDEIKFRPWPSEQPKQSALSLPCARSHSSASSSPIQDLTVPLGVSGAPPSRLRIRGIQSTVFLFFLPDLLARHLPVLDILNARCRCPLPLTLTLPLPQPILPGVDSHQLRCQRPHCCFALPTRSPARRAGRPRYHGFHFFAHAPALHRQCLHRADLARRRRRLSALPRRAHGLRALHIPILCLASETSAHSKGTSFRTKSLRGGACHRSAPAAR